MLDQWFAQIFFFPSMDLRKRCGKYLEKYYCKLGQTLTSGSVFWVVLVTLTRRMAFVAFVVVVKVFFVAIVKTKSHLPHTQNFTDIMCSI